MFSPFLCGEDITAVDFYLYTLTRWDLDKSRLREGRPNLKVFLDILRSRNSGVDCVCWSQSVHWGQELLEVKKLIESKLLSRSMNIDIWSKTRRVVPD